MTFNYQGNDSDFKDIFWLYLHPVEGYRLKVYSDKYGYPTVGLGHLVRPEDRLSVGDVITDQQVLDFFHNDYDNLNIDKYVSEAAQNYNQALAIAHFVWSHGDGDYRSSELRKHMVNRDLSYDDLISYLNSNWDVKKPANQKVNKSDFTVYFSQNPWIPSKDISYYASMIGDYFSNSAATNPILTYGVLAGVFIGIGSISFGIYRLLRKKG